MATDRSVKVRLSLDPKGFIAGAKAAGAAVNDLRHDIDKTNDRTAWLAQSFLALGPSLAPVGAAAVPALAGLVTQMVVAGVAAGTLTLAFNGVGDALKALNDYQVSPTAEHLAKLRETMDKIGPSGQQMVFVLDDLGDGLKKLANLSRDKMFPGIIDGLDELKVLAPQVEKIVSRTSRALGDLASEAGEGLAGPRFEDFFTFLKTDAIQILEQMGRIVGNVADGLAAMLVAFLPLSTSFSGGMLEMSRAFADWAHGLQDSQSFQEFVDYIQENTPHVLALLGQIVDTFLAIAEAAAPVGAVMLPIFTGLLKIVEAIADTPLGPIFIAAAAAMSLYGRAAALASITTGGLGKQVGNLGLGLSGLRREFGASITVMGKHRAALASDAAAVGRHAAGYKAAASGNASAISRWSRALAPAAVTAGAFTLAMSPIPEKLGLTNTAMGAMTGSLAGPWGAAVGAGIGLILDLADSTDVAVVAAEDLVDAIDLQTLSLNAQGYAAIGEALIGVADDAALLGIAFSDVIGAAAAGGPALDALTVQLQGVIDAGTSIDEATQTKVYTDQAYAAMALTEALGGQNDETNKAIDLAAARKAGVDAATDAEQDHKSAIDDTEGALDDLTAKTDTNKDGIIDNTDAILDNIAAMEERTDAINAAFDAETNYQRSLQVGADRAKEAADLREQIAKAQSDGAEDRAELQRRLADAQHDLAVAKTPSARKSARESIGSIQGQIQDSMESQSDTIKRLREELAEYAPTLDKTTKAGQANRDILSEMAAGWNDLSDKQQNAKGKFEEARKALIDQAMQFGATRKRAKQYADDLLEVPSKVATKILLDEQEAARELDKFSKAFHGLDGAVAKAIIQLRIDQITGKGGKLDQEGNSYAEGGYTGPGAKYEPAGVVHKGEFVVPAPYAERDRAALEKMYLPGYANGGYVAAVRQAAVTAPAIDHDRLASALLNARSLYGDVTVIGDHSFEKQMRQDAALAAKGGA